MPSFDVVSRADEQEIRNAVDQARREITTRFDLKDSHSEIEFREEKTGAYIHLGSQDEYTVDVCTDILIGKLVRRGVDPKFFERQPVEVAPGGRAKRRMVLKQGIPDALAKDIVRRIKDRKIKVQASIRGDEVRVEGKKKDDLQEIIHLLKAETLEQPLNFTNFRD